MKKKGYNGHIGLWREKPCKKLGGKRQKICCGALPSRRERGKFENFLKKCFEQVKNWFFKNLIHEFWLIETDRGSQEILKTISIDKKTDRINRKSENQHFRENNLIFENTPQSIEYNEIKCMSMRWNTFPKHKF